jgi:nucleoid-associated protein EbfC
VEPSGLAEMFLQFQKISTDLAQVQARMENQRVEVSAANGGIKIIADGQQRILAINIDPGLLSPGNRETLEDSLIAAVNDALNQSRQTVQAEVLGLTQGLSLTDLLGSW